MFKYMNINGKKISDLAQDKNVLFLKNGNAINTYLHKLNIKLNFF